MADHKSPPHNINSPNYANTFTQEDWDMTFDINGASVPEGNGNFGSGPDEVFANIVGQPLTMSNTVTSCAPEDITAFCGSNDEQTEKEDAKPLTDMHFPHTPGTLEVDTPYFHTIEHGIPLHQDAVQHSNVARRSVSEPPGNMVRLPIWQPALQDHVVLSGAGPQEPAITFHRQRHYLGKPIDQKPVSLKSLPRGSRRAKPPRHHPYQRAPKQTTCANAEEYRPHHDPAADAYYAPPPTSMPISIPIGLPYDSSMHDGVPGHSSPLRHVTSSRVCTPAPETESANVSMIDPALTGEGDATSRSSREPVAGVMLPLAIEQLCAIISEAVRKGVRHGLAGTEAAPQEVKTAMQ